MKQLLPLLVFALSVHSPATAQDKTIKIDQLGWTMPIPPGWSQMPDSMMATMPMVSQGGSDGMLVMVAKDRGNYLMSFQKQPEPGSGTWENAQQEQDQGSYDFCTRFAQMAAGSTKSDSSTHYEKINNVLFRVFEINAYSSAGQIVLSQLSFTRFVSGKTLTVIIQANSDGNKKTILDAWKRSIFNHQPDK